MGNPYGEGYSGILADQQTVLQNQGLQDAHALNQLKIQEYQQEQDKNSAIAKLLAEKPAQPLAQQMAPQEQQAAQPPDPDMERINLVMQTADNYRQKATQVMARDPKLGLELSKQADTQYNTADNLRREKLVETGDMLDHMSVLGTITDQQSLDHAKSIVEARHRGTWKQMNLPETFDAGAGKTFTQFAQSNQSAQQKVETEIKQIELKTFGAFSKAKLQKEQADATKASIEAERMRQGLPAKPGSGKTAYDRVMEEESKIDEKYADDLRNARAKIINNPKQFPASSPEPTAIAQVWAHTLGDPIVPQASPRDVALANVEKEYKTARDQKMQALDARKARLGIPTMGKGTSEASGGQKAAQESPQFVLGKVYPDAQGRNFIAGKVYPDGKGNKAKWTGSDWEPQ